MYKTLLLSLLLPLLAQSASAVAPDSLHTLQSVVVTASARLSTMRAGSPLQVFTHEELQRMGVADVAEAVKHFAGVQVKDYGGVGGLKTVGVRGLGAMHTGVSYDGVMVGNSQSGQVDISRFSLGNVSLLWLTIGQQDDIFVSARQYASAATLNIETLPLLSDTTMVVAKVGTGSFGLFSPSALWVQPVGKRLTLSAFCDWQRADGNYPYTLYNGVQRIHTKRYNSDVNTWHAEFNAHYKIGYRQSLRAKLYGFNSKRGIPGGVVYDNPYSAERLTDPNVFVQLAYENQSHEAWQLKAAAKWNYQWNRDYNRDAGGETIDKFRQNETYLTATVLWNVFEGFHVALAQDYLHNYLSTTLANCPYPSRNSWFTSFSALYERGAWKVNASLLNTIVDEHVRTGTDGNYCHRLSPAVSLIWRATDHLRLRASYKDIFRVPTLNDLYYRLIGNTNLRPEKTRQCNVGLTWNKHISSVVDYISFTADAYMGNVRDKIQAVPTMFIWKMQNIGKVRMMGVDVTAATQLLWAKDWTTYVQLSGSWIHAQDRTNKSDLFYNDQLAYTPQYSASGSVSLHSPWLDVAYNVLFTGRRYSSGYNSADTRMPSFTDHSVSLSRQWHRWRVQIDLRNIGGKNYEVVRFYPMPGFNWRATLTYQF
ncbi:MAG: TonB-dependent receptor plug domain-containing protein [Prevotella sp.]